MEEAIARCDEEREKARKKVEESEDYKRAKMTARKEFEAWKLDWIQTYANALLNEESRRKFLDQRNE